MANRPYPSFLIYIDEAGEYRWRYQTAGNHETIADSGEGYKAFQDCRAAIDMIKASWDAPVWQSKEVEEKRR